MAGHKRHGGKHGTGKIVHKDMTSHLHGMGHKDPHASAEHHAANKGAAMPHGMATDDDGDEGGEEGGAGMGSNCSY